MKITLSTTALAAILGLALASAPVTIQAQTPATAPAAAKSTKPKMNPDYRGTLTAVDTTGNTITVSTSTKDPTKLLTLTIAPTTKILRDKAAATLLDFAVGDKVSGSYTKDASGKATAVSLHFKSDKTKDATPAATPAPAASTTPAGK